MADKDDQKKLVEERGVIRTEITEEMKKSYLDYAMSVIVSRALPAVEDGLKPVHRRILYAMHTLGLKPEKPTVKSAKIVGEVIANYHPHGDISVYDAMVRMVQNFSLRYPLVTGQGNFGSIDADPAAAYRYTEAKIAKIAIELLEDLDKETVNFIPTFDNIGKEPETLPARLPNILLNGASGIAVGMATNIPPHNLNEIAEATIAMIDKPNISIDELCTIVKGPDFPTGGYVSGEIKEMYLNGKGSLTLRGKTTKEEIKGKDRENIIITEIPYNVNKSELIKEIASMAQDKKIQDISDIRDESAKGKIRVVIELKKGASADFIVNQLYKYTRLQDRFGANMLALVAGKPRILNLKQFVEEYISYRKKVLIKRTEFELKKAKDRQEIVEGLLLALKNIDEIITLIKKSKSTIEASEGLQNKFSFSKRQAQAILETKLQQLTSLERDKLQAEAAELKVNISELEKILASDKEVLSLIKKDLRHLMKEYGDDRRTHVMKRISELSEKELIEEKEVVVTITEKGYCKRIDVENYKEQKRGGKGVIGSGLSTEDFVRQLITCSTHDVILFFTNRGRVYWLKAHEIPSAERQSKGKAVANLLNLKEETITNVIEVKRFENYLIMATKLGMIKKIDLKYFINPRSTGVRAINLPNDNSDTLIGVEILKEKQEILLSTHDGQAIRFDESEIRPMGRSSYGVTGIKMDKGDEVVGLEILDTQNKKGTILSVTEKGYGKRSAVEDYRKTGRAGKGVINLKVSDKTGKMVTTVSVKNEDDVIITTAKGMMIRVPVDQMRVMGRATQGVRMVKMKESGDKVTDVVKVVEEDDKVIQAVQI